MLFSRVKTIEYTPKFAGNREDANPAVIELKVMSAAEMEEFSVKIKESPKATDFFRFGFVSCINVYAQANGETVELTDADSIINAPGLSSLVRECADAFIEANTLGGDSKND